MPAARGSIIQQGNSPNLTIIAPYMDADGRHRQKWKTVKRIAGESDTQLKKCASEELQELIVKLRHGEPVPTGRMKLNDFVEDEWLPSVRLQVTFRTAEGYQATLRRHVLGALGQKRFGGRWRNGASSAAD